METIIVLLIVVLAFAYVGQKLYRQFRGKSGCCSSKCSCETETKDPCETKPDSP